MFDTQPSSRVALACAVEELETAALADAVVDLGRRQRALGARRLVLAVTWADRHLPVCRQGRLPEGCEPVCGCQEPDSAPVWVRRVRACRWPGHDGTPAVSVSGIAEFAVLCSTTTLSGSLLLGDALDLRHRLPRLWARVLAGAVEDWQARRVARMCAVLDRDQARAVDAAIADLVGELAWSRVLEAVEGEIVRVDPEGHEARRREAEVRAFVSAGRYRGTNAAGMRSLVAQLKAADVTRMDAMIQHVADLFAAAGDTDGNDLRRAKALVLLVSSPGRATLLLGGIQHPDHITPAGAATTGAETGAETGPATPEPEPEPEEDELAPLTAPQLAAAVGRALAEQARGHGVRDLWARLAPATSLVIHLSEDAVRSRGAGTGTVPGPVGGVARMAEATGPLGPIGFEQLRELLAEELPDLLLDFLTHSENGENGETGEGKRRLRDRLTLTPVIDTTGQVPVDAYEVPPAMRAALEHTRGYEAFPWGTLEARRAQADHTQPYDHGDPGGSGDPGGRPPPGQTRLDNLGPLSTGHHNLKTHHGWTCHQPLPGLYLWRTPSGHWYQVDHTGTRALGREMPAILRHGPERPRGNARDPDAWAPPTAPEITDEELDHLLALSDPPDLAA